MGFFSQNNSFLGVDIGTSGIKIVELVKDNSEAKLVSYGFSENKVEGVKNDWKIDVDKTARTIEKICKESGMHSRKAIASLPSFSVFSSIINLTNINDKDLQSAVQWEAKKVIPLSLEEMILDWRIIGGSGAISEKKDDIKVFLTGAPRVLVKRYLDIFKAVQINLYSLETETFSLIRVLLGNDKSSVMIVDLGANTTNISIVENGIPMLSRSIDIGGRTITKAISNNLNIAIERAEQFKYDLGIRSFNSREDVIPKTIIENISPILNEIKYTLTLFQSKNEVHVEKIILAGGGSMLINLASYLSKILNIKVIIGDPWARISYPTDLKSSLDEIGVKLTVALGLAMREME